MLKLRIASGLSLAAVVAAAVILLPAAWLAAFFHVLGLVAAYEWARLAGVSARTGHIGYAAALSALVAVLWLTPGLRTPALWLVVGFWIAAFAVVRTYPRSRPVLRSTPMMLAAGIIVLAGAWLALMELKEAAPRGEWVVWLLAAVAVADTAAYFAGRRFGRRKLSVHVSPGKTWEGAAAGALATLAWGVCGAWFFAGSLAAWLAVAALLFLAALVGDLFESALKRSRGVKDSGALLPGHGGVLDRIDSLVAAAPVLALLGPFL